MKHKINWKKGFFSCTYHFYELGRKIGSLKDAEWSRSAAGILVNSNLHFQTFGFIPKTVITDRSTNEVVGSIRFNCWLPKAIINYKDQTAKWKYENIWETRWKVDPGNSRAIRFSGSLTQGQVKFNEKNEFYLLAGMFIASYYRRVALSIILSSSVLPIGFLI